MLHVQSWAIGEWRPLLKRIGKVRKRPVEFILWRVQNTCSICSIGSIFCIPYTQPEALISQFHPSHSLLNGPCLGSNYYPISSLLFHPQILARSLCFLLQLIPSHLEGLWGKFYMVTSMENGTWTKFKGLYAGGLFRSLNASMLTGNLQVDRFGT